MLPFVNRKCEEINVRPSTLVTRSFPQVDFNVAFQTPRTIGRLFRFKDNIKSNTEISHVIYLINCKECGASHIGKAKRILSEKLSEHRSNFLFASRYQACKQHELSTGHEIDYDGVEVKDSANTVMKLDVKELLLILKKQPAINKLLNAQSKFDHFLAIGRIFDRIN